MGLRRRVNQLYDGKSWDGFTDRNHLFTAMADDPTTYMGMVEDVLDMDMGMDFVSMVEKHQVDTIDAGADGRYEWSLDYMPDMNYVCLGAWFDREGTSAVGTTDTPGIAYTKFYMDFEGDVFQDTEVIAGPNPNTEILYVLSRYNVSGDVWRYEVQVANATSEDDFINGTAVQNGARWNEEYGLVSHILSDKGVDISFKTPVRAANELAAFRLEHTVSGHNMNYRPKYFYYRDENGKASDKNVMWLSTVEYELLRKARRMRAALIMYGRSNRNRETGRVALKSEAGFEIISGSGWQEQFLSSNRHYWTGAPDLDEMTNIILDVVVGTTSFGRRRAVVRGGEWGLIELSKMVQRKYGSAAFAWQGDDSGRAYTWTGNGINFKTGQIMGIALVNGIELVFMIDSSKDDQTRNKVDMPGLPGKVSSYQYDIIGLGGRDAESNLRIVRRADEEPTFGILQGMRGPVKGGTSFNNPRILSTAVDGSTWHYKEHGVGAKVNDPTRIIQYWPSVLPYDN